MSVLLMRRTKLKSTLHLQQKFDRFVQPKPTKMKSTILTLILLVSSCVKVGRAADENLCPNVVDFSYEGRIRYTLQSQNLDAYVVELLVAQSKHESGNYRNSLTPYNNVFARHYSKYDTFATSAGAKAEGHSRFAKYPSIEYATLSQVEYLKRKEYSFKWKSPYQFALELKKKGYYEAPLKEYTNALIKHME